MPVEAEARRKKVEGRNRMARNARKRDRASAAAARRLALVGGEGAIMEAAPNEGGRP